MTKTGMMIEREELWKR